MRREAPRGIFVNLQMNRTSTCRVDKSFENIIQDCKKLMRRVDIFLSIYVLLQLLMTELQRSFRIVRDATLGDWKSK